MEELKIPEGIGLLKKRQRGEREGKDEKGEKGGGEKGVKELRIDTGKDASNRELSVELTLNVALSLMMRRLFWSIRERD